MAQIIINIENCNQCPHWKAENFNSTDGWDSMEDWMCYYDPDNKRKIAGAVEWHDKIAIPDWCKISLTNNKQITNE